MLMRISLIIAIIAGLAAGTLSFVKVKEKIDGVVAERDTEHSGRLSAENERDKTKADLAKTEKELSKTKDSLVKTEQERAAAVAEAEALTKKSNELTEKLAKTIQERDDASAKLASFESTGFTPPQILALGKQLQQAKDEYEVSLAEKKIIERELEKTKEKLYALIDPDHVVRMKADMRGQVLVADPKWEFVVLSVGEEEGAKLNGELLVSRNGRLVAKVIIREVQKDRAIANLLPGWKLGDVAEGDQVIPANPES